MKPKPEIKPAEERAPLVKCWTSLVLAVAIAAVSAMVLKIDIENNAAMGARMAGSHGSLGLLFATVAIGFALFPAVAAVRGRWCFVTLGATTFAGVITLTASYFAYTNGLGSQVSGVTERQQRIETARANRDRARRDIDQAESDARAAGELAASATLREQRRAALERIELETKKRGGCPKMVKRDGATVKSDCAKAEDEAAALLPRIAAAEARERAEARAVEARKVLASVEGEADAEKPQQEDAAVLAAAYLDTSPEAAASAINRTIAVLAMIFTAFMALAMHTATAFGMHAVGFIPLAMRPQAEPQPRKQPEPRPEPEPAVQKVKPRRTGRPKLTREQRIHQFAREWLLPGEGETRAAHMQDAFTAWWESTCPGQKRPDNKLVAKELVKAGVRKDSRGGYIRYYAKIRPA